MKLANISRQDVIATKVDENLYIRLDYAHLRDFRLDMNEQAPRGLTCVVIEL